MAFNRSMEDDQFEKMSKNPLFGKLKEDIFNGEVFFAIRPNAANFYYKGASLYRFNGDYFTHLKYASVLMKDDGDDYVNENDLSSLKLIADFLKGYHAIKENAGRYSGEERRGICNICEKWSYAKKGLESNFVMLDIEICLDNSDDDPEKPEEDLKAGRIDFLVLDKISKKLRFFEAKLMRNPDLRSAKQEDLTVISQVRGYEQQLKKGKDSIVEQYGSYIEILKERFDLSLPKPEKLDPHVGVLVFGYGEGDEKKKANKIKHDINNHLGSKRCYAIGHPENINLQTLWKETSGCSED